MFVHVSGVKPTGHNAAEYLIPSIVWIEFLPDL